jgi:hypothetical protein
MCLLTKKQVCLMLTIGLLLGFSGTIVADPVVKVNEKNTETRGNELVLCKLCADKIKSKYIQTKDLKAEDICTEAIRAERECVESLRAKDVCAQHIVTDSICTTSALTQDLCAFRAALRSLCVERECVSHLSTNTLNVTDTICLQGDYCVSYRSFMSIGVNTNFVLGSGIPFDSIVDDPNHNITLNNPSFYTAPRSGYYIVTASIAETNLTGSTVFTGVPTADIEVLVNGVIRLRERNAYLSFSKLQTSIVSGLLILNAGDEVSVNYQLFILDPVLGEIPYVGSVTLISAGPSQTYMATHYLSSLCPTPSPCQTCAKVDCPRCDFEALCKPSCKPCDFSCKPNPSQCQECDID